MPIHTQLRDLYAFPGFHPATHIHGVFGDSYAVVIPLRRLSKKRPAELAAPSPDPSTIKRFATFATWKPVVVASISRCQSAASPAVRVRP